LKKSAPFLKIVYHFVANFHFYRKHRACFSKFWLDEVL